MEAIPNTHSPAPEPILYAVHVQNFHKQYQDAVAVEDLTFTVAPGEIMGLVGPNGAGKTTTLRALSGIIPPSSGTLTVAGYDVATNPVEAKRRLAYVSDEPRLFESLTVWEHLEFVAAAYRVQDWQPRAERLLGEFQIDERRDTLAQELSRGMRQKVAVACAWLHKPSVILFDEPLVGLDPRGIRTLKTSIVERAAAGAAVIISSHMLTLVEDMCSHLLILDRGRRRFFGAITQARDVYRDLRDVASLEEIFFRATEGPIEAAPDAAE